MKKPFILLLLSLFLFPITGEELHARKRDFIFTPGSEITLSIGSLPLDETRNWFGYYEIAPSWTYFVNSYHGNYNLPSFNSFYNNNQTYQGAKYISGAISAGYTYRFTSWFELSCNLSYSGSYRNNYDIYTSEYVYSSPIHQISLTPVARFVWLNREYVKLYSSIGLGVAIVIEREQGIKAGYYFTDSGSAFCNPIGIKVGKKVYGFGELSLGTLGIFTVGIGYRFNY